MTDFMINVGYYSILFAINHITYFWMSVNLHRMHLYLTSWSETNHIISKIIHIFLRTHKNTFGLLL